MQLHQAYYQSGFPLFRPLSLKKKKKPCFAVERALKVRNHYLFIDVFLQIAIFGKHRQFSPGSQCNIGYWMQGRGRHLLFSELFGIFNRKSKTQLCKDWDKKTKAIESNKHQLQWLTCSLLFFLVPTHWLTCRMHSTRITVPRNRFYNQCHCL